MTTPAFLSGDRVTLRPIEEEDLEFLQEWINDPRIWRAIGRRTPVNQAQEQEFFEEVVCGDETIDFLVDVDGTRVGIVGFNSIVWRARRAEIGYWLAPDHHEQGYGTEAAELVVAYGFDQLGFHRIEARVFEFNEPSQRLLESIGFSREGVHRDAWFADGEHQDTYWYGLLAGEWRNGRK
ncbi:GNAT family N-acetyltransferase [Natrialba swarupiae]|uniref:GNAT family N-acetyltransferase n=1 Tax=Natrialba swarupiae TaxID=2448032 RepID=A0A5D5AN48_9EURY|nr:GNAT family protein [Natrialba swarupiae]TYT63288.1 GNAT family N-acetyltransferase [Natrialba swarupiae]